MRVSFGDCVLDTGTRELLRRGRAVEISPKAFLLLEALIETRPRAVGKAELHKLLWPQTHVAATSLPRLVNEVRKAIGDGAEEPRFVRTLPRFGYAFAGPVAELAATPPVTFGFWLARGAERIPLAEGENILGRSSESRVPLGESRVSRRHARIVVSSPQATLEDLGSRNGTRVNGRKVQAPVVLRSGDRIGVGSTELVFFSAQDSGPSTDEDLSRSVSSGSMSRGSHD